MQREIPVIAQIELEVSTENGTTAHVPMFVSENADPSCLLGLRAIMDLGLMSLAGDVEIRHARGKSPGNPNPTTVRLIGECRIQPDHGTYLRVQVEGSWKPGNPCFSNLTRIG